MIVPATTPPKPPPDPPALVVPFGAQPILSGVLRDDAQQPLAGVTVTITSQARRLDAPTVTLGQTVTQSNGKFSYQLPAGPSRRVTFASPTAQMSVNVLVEGRVTIGAARTVANGGSLTFTGRVDGPDVPQGSVVVIQAKDGRAWRPFAIVFTGANGLWKYTYRFRPIRARAIYHFRSELLAQPRLAYQPSSSRVIRVTERAPGG